MMRVTYLVNGKKVSTSKSNKDLLINVEKNNERVTYKVKALSDVTLVKAKELIDLRVNFHDVYFLNGYQSWTDTREYALAKRLRNIRKSPHIISHMFAMDKYGDAPFYRYAANRSHGYDIFYSKGKNSSFIYNLNYKNAYLIVELTKSNLPNFCRTHLISDVENITLKKDEEFVLFDYKYFHSYEEGMKAFEEDFPLQPTKKIFGYTSWYNYYQNINEEIILRDLKALDCRFNVFQIDDGYESFVGDWLNVDEKNFPHGLKPIVEEIHKYGYKAGIWLAPFAVEEKSKTFAEHPDWIKKDEKGHPIKCGGNWSGFYSLDLSKQEAVDYVKDCLNHYIDLGFDFFKLDFLYCVGLGKYEGLSRSQVQERAYQLLRDVLKDKIILGCGANIINSYGKFDYLRIGPDVSLSFDDAWFMRMFHRERVSTKVTIQNTIFRSFMNRRLFGNDPDVFLLRDENIKLNENQKIALAAINALFGSILMTSDNIATYNEHQNQLLEQVFGLFYHSKVTGYSIKRNIITINYLCKDKPNTLKYNLKKGVLENA